MYRLILTLLLVLLHGPAWSDLLHQPVLHRLALSLDPASSRLDVSDTLEFNSPRESIEFFLNAGLTPATDDPSLKLEKLVPGNSAVRAVRYRIRSDQPRRSFSLSYSGIPGGALSRLGEGYAGGRESSALLIDPQGAFLSGGGLWYPVLSEPHLLRFDLRVSLPQGWSAIAQGMDQGDNHWIEDQPQDEIVMVAGPYQRYRRQVDGISLEAWLLQPDQVLADSFIDSAEKYLAQFQALLGPYPYRKFALVENHWQSGYGMPSYTLLGSQVIRLPFIRDSSFPHELLHNWWGNSVYIDATTGNWAEGLTSYLADHWIREQQGRGDDYRRESLQRYRQYVTDDTDFPLTAFRSNTGQTTQAVGYGKTLMMMHMLRRELGDDRFIAGLRRFYRDNRFKSAAFADLRRAFEQVSSRDLRPFFSQWTERTGAPDLQLEANSVERTDSGYRLSVTLAQRQATPYRLQVPVFVQLAGEETARQQLAEMDRRRQTFSFIFDSRPQWLAIDPRFELFRRLDDSEIPPTLGTLFGARGPMILLPAASGQKKLTAYRKLAQTWASEDPSITISLDKKIRKLPKDRAIWILGRENRFAGPFEERLNAIRGKVSDSASTALALEQNGNPLGLIDTELPERLDLLARKLPHYGKYGYLVFQGPRMQNRAKGNWPAGQSRLTIRLDETATTPLKPPISPALAPGGQDR